MPQNLNLNLSDLGNEIYQFSLSVIEENIKKFGHIRSQVFYPKQVNDEEVEILAIELSRIFDQLIDEFDIKSPFENKSSDYFNFMHETALNILKIKITNESPNLYIFVTQNEDNSINIIIRDSSSFGITKVNLIYAESLLKILNIERLPSNSYTNPLYINE